MSSIETLNAWGETWMEFAWGSFLEATIILTLVGAVWMLLRRWMSAQFGYCLFLLVLIKLCLPVSFDVSETVAFFSPSYAIDRLGDLTISSDERPSVNGAAHKGPGFDAGTLERLLALLQGGEPDSAATAAQAPSLGLSVPAMLMSGWVVVVVVLLVWFLASQIRLARKLRTATVLEPSALPIDWEELRRSAGVKQSVRLLGSDVLRSPAICGLLHPCIILPTGITKALSEYQLRWALLHELAHIRRRDLWVATFQRLVQISQFFNPAIWLANRLINQQREYACDDAALTAASTSRRQCGVAFVTVIEWANRQQSRFVPALGVFSAKEIYRRRLMRIVDEDRPVRASFTSGSLVTLLALSALLLPKFQAIPQEVSESDGQQANESVAENADDVFLFSADREGNYEIFIVRPDGTFVKNLTDHPSDDFSPAWSPDGKRVAFSSNRAGNVDIYVMDANGGNVQQLTSDLGREDQAAWSPDGRKIVFRRWDSQSNDRDRGLVVMNADGSDQTSLSDFDDHEGDAAWSPDGSKVAFMSKRTGRYGLYVMQADGSDAQLISRETATFTSPAWSPDGQYLAYHGYDKETRSGEVVLNEYESGSIRKLTSLGGINTYMAWSADGESIAFVHTDVNTWEETKSKPSAALYIIGADGSNLREVLSDFQFRRDALIRPAWKPR